MKHLTIYPTLLLSMLMHSNPAFTEEATSLETRKSFDVYIPQLQSGFEVTGGVLFLSPNADNLGWGVITNFLPFVTPVWTVEELDPGFQPAFNLGLRYVFSSVGVDTQLNWTRLRSSDTDSVSVIPIAQWVSPFSQTGPGTANTTWDATGVGELTNAYANVKFSYDVVDLNMGVLVNIGSRLQMRTFSGLRGARIKEKISSTFESLPESLPKISLNNTATYKGIGPRLGFLSTYDMYKHFNLVGELAAGLLFGRMSPAQYEFEGSSEALEDLGISINSEQISSRTVSKTVPVFDAKLGLSYAYHFCKRYIWSIEAGYTGSFYINPISGYETNENILSLELGSLSTGSMKHIQSNFSVNGPYASMSFKF